MKFELKNHGVKIKTTLFRYSVHPQPSRQGNSPWSFGLCDFPRGLGWIEYINVFLIIVMSKGEIVSTIYFIFDTPTIFLNSSLCNTKLLRHKDRN